MNLKPLVAAAERAIAVRGTVMVTVRGDDRLWAAICVAVDGSIELRVGEPARGWRYWRPAPGEAWLRGHGFVHVIDAWSALAPHDAGTWACAELLATALRDGLDAPDGAELVEALVHPGLIGDLEAPEPTAPHVEHLRHALLSLVERGSGKMDVQGGSPACTWAWVFVEDGELLLEPEPVETDLEYPWNWTVTLDGVDPVREADRLTAVLHDEIGRSPNEPLFIGFMD
jgi:hypothetical protein